MKVDLPVYSSKQIGQDVGSPSCCTKDGGSDPLQMTESDFDHFFQLMKFFGFVSVCSTECLWGYQEENKL